MNRNRYRELLQLKDRFINDKGIDPNKNDILDEEIAQSWLRSKKKGVDPSRKIFAHVLPMEMYGANAEQIRLLIKIAKPLFNNFQKLAGISGYALYLFNKDSYIIMKSGVTANPTSKEESPEIIPHTEENVGTMAHILSMRSKRPIQLFGAEHYSMTLGNLIASSAPILDENNYVIGCLSLSQELPPDEEVWDLFNAHTHALITSMAQSFESHYRLYKSYEQISKLNFLQEETIDLIDDGVVTIDNFGKILHCNKEACKIFGMSARDLKQRYIREFLPENSDVMEAIKAGSNSEIEVNIDRKGKESSFLFNILPVSTTENDVSIAVLKISSARKINAMLGQRLGAVPLFRFEDILGSSKTVKNMVTRAKSFARTSENILLMGESGTGKELLAQAIHNEYNPNGPFIAINCAAMPRELIESELFGYESGSFTGADKKGRQGKIELAHQGTLFLDEIGDMPIELQTVFLRVLQDKQVMRIGGSHCISVDFRLIAATNKNLYDYVQEKRFREDLFYRLSVLTINLPPLRNRENDVDLLANYFVRHYSQKIGIKQPEISEETIEIIRKYNWPGNIRELENAMIYAVNVCEDKEISPKSLPEIILMRITDSGNTDDCGSLSLKKLEQDRIFEAMELANHKVAEAADMLGMHRSSLYRKLREYGIR